MTAQFRIGLSAALAFVVLVVGIGAFSGLEPFRPYISGFKMPNAFARLEPNADAEIFVSTPAFSMQDGDGSRHTVVVNMHFEKLAEAATICRWMPILLDRINAILHGVDMQNGDKRVRDLLFEKKQIRISFAQLHESLRPSGIDFINLTLNESPYRSGSPPLVCDGNRIDLQRTHLYVG